MSDFLDDVETVEIKSGDDLFTKRDHNIQFQMLDEFQILIFPREIKSLPSKNKNPEPGKETYEAIICDILLVDGHVNRKLSEAGLRETPFMAEGIAVSSGQVKANIRDKIGSMKGIPALVNSRPSQGSSGTAMGIEPAPNMAKLPAAVLDKASKIKADYLAKRAGDEFGN